MHLVTQTTVSYEMIHRGKTVQAKLLTAKISKNDSVTHSLTHSLTAVHNYNNLQNYKNILDVFVISNILTLSQV